VIRIVLIDELCDYLEIRLVTIKGTTSLATITLIVLATLILDYPDLIKAQQIGNQQSQQTNQKKISPSVYVTLFNIDRKTGDVFTFVSTHNTTEARLFNATELDLKDKKIDGVTEVGFSFGNLTIKVGDPYKACVVVLRDQKLLCQEDHFSRLARPDFVDLILELTGKDNKK
jgi:hypothetical protein